MKIKVSDVSLFVVLFVDVLRNKCCSVQKEELTTSAIKEIMIDL